MRRRVLLVLASATIVYIVVANNTPAASSRAADWSRPRVVHHRGMTVVVPRGWHSAKDGAALVLSTAHTSIWLARYGPKYASEFPARPESFQLRDEDRAFQTCGFDFVGWNFMLADGGQAVQAVVRVDPGASRSDAARVLDGLGLGG